MIMEFVIWLAVFAACFVLQTTVVPVVGIFGIQPDLLLIALMVLAIRHGSMSGIWAGFILGLAQDIYAPSVLGQHAFANAIVGFFIGLFNERVMSTGPLVKLAILLVSFVLHDSLFVAVEVAKHGAALSAALVSLLTQTIPRAAYSLCCAGIYFLWEYITRTPALKR